LPSHKNLAKVLKVEIINNPFGKTGFFIAFCALVALDIN